MINALHLLWVIPLTSSLTMLCMALVVVNKEVD